MLIGYANYVRMVDPPKGASLVARAKELAARHGWQPKQPPRKPSGPSGRRGLSVGGAAVRRGGRRGRPSRRRLRRPSRRRPKKWSQVV